MNQQEAIDFVVVELGKHRSKDEVTRLLTERVGCSWDEAQQFVYHVQFEHRTKIAAHQSPLLILLAIVTIVSGLGLSGYYGSAIYFRLSMHALPGYGQFMYTLMGLSMVVGACIGLWQSIRAMWK